MLSLQEVTSDIKLYIKVSKEHKSLQSIVELYDSFLKIIKDIDDLKNMLSIEKEDEFKELIKTDLNFFEKKKVDLEERLKDALIEKDPNDSKDIILEIRAGTGGDEASIFAGDLFRMYKRFSDKKNWKFEVISFLDGSSGGYKEIISSISGVDVYAIMKFESGVHRVQRVPDTETQGRIHTSAASVVVLPQADDLDIVLNMNDIRKDTFCSSGPGGQSVNTTYSAIRLTHAPTGIVVSCQDEKSQIKNFEKALKVLKSRIYDIEMEKQQKILCQERKSMVKNSDRSDKIRTYNYPQGRITDHRISYSIYNLESFMDGNIDDMVENLRISSKKLDK